MKSWVAITLMSGIDKLPRSNSFDDWRNWAIRFPCSPPSKPLDGRLFLYFSEELSRRLARYYLAIVLFQSPLAERSVTVSVSLRSPAVNVVALRRQVILSATLALRISRTAWPLSSDHLCPF